MAQEVAPKIYYLHQAVDWAQQERQGRLGAKGRPTKEQLIATVIVDWMRIEGTDLVMTQLNRMRTKVCGREVRMTADYRKGQMRKASTSKAAPYDMAEQGGVAILVKRPPSALQGGNVPLS